MSDRARGGGGGVGLSGLEHVGRDRDGGRVARASRAGTVCLAGWV